MVALRFDKIHGLGNDFVVVDGAGGIAAQIPSLAPELCHRRFGIGADGVIAVSPSTDADWKMEYWNADGSRAQCGNGIRSVARYLLKHALVAPEVQQFSLETDNGVLSVGIEDGGAQFRVDMGPPRFAGREVPIATDEEWLDRPLVVDGEEVRISAVSMGNPHCVLLVPDVATAPVERLGPLLERHSFYPERTNVEFVEIVSPSEVRQRTFERGCGETLACGTGACAVVAALVRLEKVSSTVRVRLRGGDCEVTYDENNGHLYLTGPAEYVFSGEVDLG